MGYFSDLTNRTSSRHQRSSVVSSVVLSGLALVLSLVRPMASLLRLFAVAGIVMALGFQLLKAPDFPFWTIVAVCFAVFLIGLLADSLRHAVNDALAERDQNNRN